MIENSRIVVAKLEPPETGGAPSPWVNDASGSEPTRARGRRILVVDDEVSLRSCLRMMLEMDGYQVTEAGDGAEALHLFAAGEFDLVITDFEMPVMRGDKLAVGIKLRAPAQPILMITASARAHRDDQNPVEYLLTKPFSIAELRSAIEALLSSRPEPAHAVYDPIHQPPAVVLAPEPELVPHPHA